MASYRFAWRPRWVAGHVLVLAAVVTMIFLGRWQLTVSNRKGFSLQNFGYALQWWAFCLFATFFWLKILRDQKSRAPSQPAQPPAAVTEPVAYRRYVMPTAVEDTDPEISRYNAYLASLAEREKS